MRTKSNQRLSFEVRYILIIDDNSYTVVARCDINHAVETNQATLILRFYAESVCIAVYDFLPREHTSALALKIAKSYVETLEVLAGLN